MVESVQISSYTSRVARELRPQCRLSFFGTFLAVLALIFSDLKNTYSYVCFFLLLHPCCFRASGILRGLHTSCMGSRSNAVNVFAWNVVSDDTIRSLTLYLSIHFYAMILKSILSSLNCYEPNYTFNICHFVDYPRDIHFQTHARYDTCLPRRFTLENEVNVVIYVFFVFRYQVLNISN